MKQSLSVLIEALPAMRCDRGCTDCCGPVEANEKEIRAIDRYINEHDIRPAEHPDNPLQCPFMQQGRCVVYPVRPFLCRLFGHSPRLVCSRGYNVNIDPRLERRMNRLYERREPRRLLHNAFRPKSRNK